MNRIGNGLMMALIGVGLATAAAYWLIRPINHPDASDARVAAVAIQLVIGIAMTIWGSRRHDVERRARGSSFEVFASGVVCLVIGTALASTALHWLMTPMAHPDASTLRTSLVWGQVVAGIGLMAISRPRLKSENAT